MNEELLTTTTPEPDDYPQLIEDDEPWCAACNCPLNECICGQPEESFVCECEECTCEDYCGDKCFCCCVEKPAEPSTWQIWKWMIGDSSLYAIVYFIILSLPWKWALVADVGGTFLVYW